VSERVVEPFEIVQVEHEQRHLLAVAARARDLGLQALIEVPMVEQAGEAVGDRLHLEPVVQSGVDDRQCGDVGQPHHQAQVTFAELAPFAALDQFDDAKQFIAVQDGGVERGLLSPESHALAVGRRECLGVGLRDHEAMFREDRTDVGLPVQMVLDPDPGAVLVRDLATPEGLGHDGVVLGDVLVDAAFPAVQRGRQAFGEQAQRPGDRGAARVLSELEVGVLRLRGVCGRFAVAVASLRVARPVGVRSIGHGLPSVVRPLQDSIGRAAGGLKTLRPPHGQSAWSRPPDFVKTPLVPGGQPRGSS